MFLRRISVVGPKWLFAALSIVISTATFAAGLETNVDRKGMNFRRILLAAANPQLCQSECVGDAACKAFTYVKPTLKKRRAVCYLKTGVPKRSKTRCCVSGVRPVATSAHLRHFKYQADQAWLKRIVVRSSIDGQHDTLTEYARKCDEATGITVPPFNCDAGVGPPDQGAIPATHPPSSVCDKPNVLNRVCDPGSKFQVLPGGNTDAVAVAHCRKDGLPIPGSLYNDIAVIQHNKANGAACFYQALTNLPGQNVPAPRTAGETPWQSGNSGGWFSPQRTEGIGCTACHDNGAFIRSPYLAQLTAPPHALPSTASGFNNLTTPLRFVGLDWGTNRSWSISTSLAPSDSGPSCTGCHRLAVNNNERLDLGTAIDFAMRATAETQTSKTKPHRASSPIWMRPGQIAFKAPAEASATKIRDCARAFRNSGFTTTPAGCTASPLAEHWAPPPPPPHHKPIACSVFNDGGGQMSSLSEAIYFADPQTACIPDGSSRGLCRRWFGNCVATSDNASVTFKVFDDGESNVTPPSGAIYNRASGSVCIPDGSATGNCRRWFGLPVTSDGRIAECYLFDDGLANWVGPTHAIYYSGPGKVCMPDGTPTGTCRKWFGNCQVTDRHEPPPPPPPKPVTCKVWDDSGSESGLSGAVYFAGANAACVPDGTSRGFCRRWFGRCVTTTDNVPVSFKVFNDGESNATAPSDGVFTNGPNTACIADGTASGTCRRWFGSPTTPDGRSASCYLFNDGGTNKIGPTGAIYYRGPGQVCMPDGTATGACRKWFGDCAVP